MKKIMIFSMIFLLTGAYLYSQSWTERVCDNWDIEYTVITQEQFDRIRRAQETTAVAVRLTYFDNVQMVGRVIRGTRPNFNGFFYLSVRYIPRTPAARESVNVTAVTAVIEYGNSRTGIMRIEFLNTVWLDRAISLRFNWNDYVRRYNQLIRLVNGE